MFFRKCHLDLSKHFISFATSCVCVSGLSICLNTICSLWSFYDEKHNINTCNKCENPNLETVINKKISERDARKKALEEKKKKIIEARKKAAEERKKKIDEARKAREKKTSDNKVEEKEDN